MQHILLHHAVRNACMQNPALHKVVRLKHPDWNILYKLFGCGQSCKDVFRCHTSHVYMMALASGVLDMVPVIRAIVVSRYVIHNTPVSFCKTSSRARTVRVMSRCSGPQNRKNSSLLAVDGVDRIPEAYGCKSRTTQHPVFLLILRRHCCGSSASLSSCTAPSLSVTLDRLLAIPCTLP
jgi:hypothetical protein